MNSDPSATLYSSTVPLPHEPVDGNTFRVTNSSPQDSLNEHLSLEEDIAKPVVSIAIFKMSTNSITMIRSNFLEADDDKATKLELKVDAILADRAHLNIWKELDKMFGTLRTRRSYGKLDRVQQNTLQ